MEIIIKIQIDGDEVKISQIKEEEPKKILTSGNCECSQFARFFDDGCVGWTKDPEYNLCFLLQQQNYCNDMLRSRGHLFLNEVYDMLGIPRTKAGAVMGWIYNEDCPGENIFVSFGLYSERNQDFINGYERVALLDFNVYGNILDLI